MSSSGPAMNPSRDTIAWTNTLPIITSGVVVNDKTTARPARLIGPAGPYAFPVAMYAST